MIEFIKSSLIVIAASLLFTSCNNNNQIDEKTGLENNFKIVGKISGAGNEKISLEAQSQQGIIHVAEATLDENGTFELTGNIPGFGIYSAVLGGNARNAIIIPLNVNDQVTINGTKETFSTETKFEGTSWAKPMNQYMKLFNEFAKQQMEQMPKIKDQEAQLKHFLELKKPITIFAQKQINKDPSNPANIVLVNLIMPSQEMGFSGWDSKNLDLLRKMDQAYSKTYPDSPLSKMLTQQIVMIETEYENNRRYTSGEMDAPEITLPNPQGTELKLSNLKGKVVLVDFWASWCAPCRRENPNVVRLYKTYNNQGFEVFSVSLDEDATAWKAAIEKDGLIWSNHVSDLKGWQTPLTQVYGFQSIPHTVLLNREGKIVAVGLRGTELEQKLIELLKK